MPHVIVKLWPGPSEKQKATLAAKIVEDIVTTLKLGDESVSVAIEEVAPEDWNETVYQPEIAKNMAKLYKKPGYDPLDL
jgi:4-oxalocrotonate tautomerase